jgi:hypothetical protein
MDHFTQLGLSGKSEAKPQGKISNNPSGRTQGPNLRKLTGKQRTAALAGSLITSALLGVFLLESGCSKESNKTTTIAPPAATQPSLPVATTPASTSTPLPAQHPAKKKMRQRKLSASTYSNPAYGVSFQYPKTAALKEGDDANLQLDGFGPLEMNFVGPGGETVGAVELPRTFYTGTDFNAAFFSVSMNPELTSDECDQFAFPQSVDPETDPMHVAKTKVGATEFHAVEGFAGGDNNQADIKYYHVFQNGSCYEFTLALQTARQTTPDEIRATVKPVNRNEVFRQLSWILSTVKLQPAELNAKTTPEVASGPTITQAH